MKIYYSLDDNGKVTLGNINEVRVTYEDVVDATATGEDNFASKDSDDFAKDSDDFSRDSDNFSTEATVQTTSTDETISTPATTVVIDGTTLYQTTITYPVDENDSNAQLASNTGKESTVNEGETTTQATGPASFTDSERAELEALKKEKKLALIKNYEEYLTDEEKENFESHLDDYTEESLELALLKIYKESSSNDNFSRVAPLAAPEPVKQETADSQLNSYIRRVLRK